MRDTKFMDERHSPKLWTVRETARSLGVGERTVWRRISTGDLPTVRIGRSVRIPAKAVEEFIRKGGTQ